MSPLAFAPSLDSRPVLPEWFPRLRQTAIGRALVASAVIHALLFAFVPEFRKALPTIPPVSYTHLTLPTSDLV